MSARFQSKVALVAGGTGGLGRAVTLAFLEEGAKVVVTYRKPDEFDAVKRAAGANASSLAGHQVDVTDEAAVSQLTGRILSEHGRVDVLVNTVGAYVGGMKFWETETKVFDQMLALNVRSGYILSRAVVPAMLKQRRGAIINVASKAAFDHAAEAADRVERPTQAHLDAVGEGAGGDVPAGDLRVTGIDLTGHDVAVVGKPGG